MQTRLRNHSRREGQYAQGYLVKRSDEKQVIYGGGTKAQLA